MPKPKLKPAGRILSLDYLRGYFVLVIIIDHLWQFPSLWALLSGEAKLWVTAAEGFVMISGFLIGYIRGYKGMRLPFLAVARKLLSRAALLYFWMIIVSMGYIWLEWHKRVPNMPYTKFVPEDAPHTYWEAFIQFSSGHPHAWIHFLYLYAIFLVLSIGAVFLFRKRLSWVVLIVTLALYLVGIVQDTEWMKWQIIFFLPSIVGFHFETIRTWWHGLSAQNQHTIRHSTYLASGLVLFASIMTTYLPQLFSTDLITTLSSIFVIEAFTPLRILVAGLWFVAIAFIFEWLTPYIQKYSRGTLEYLGTHSLTAYVAHGFVICLVNFTLARDVPVWWQIPYHTLLGLLTLAGVYIVIRLPLFRSMLPR
jgi:hypothetical protein